MKLIAFHLPQFHPIPENDAWWGKGFTEWTNTAKAKPLFKGHYQPHIPADLGFYDLRLHEARVAQADLAQAYGIDAFCYYHYWFAGKLLLEQPLDGLLRREEPHMPYMMCWANQTWSGIWHGAPNKILIEQTYPGLDDEKAHFAYLLPFFRDPRYLKIDGRPVFSVYRSPEIPNLKAWVALWQSMAQEHGLPGLYLIAVNQAVDAPAIDAGFQAVVEQRFARPVRETFVARVERKSRQILGLPKLPERHDFEGSFDEILRKDRYTEQCLPMVVPNWDNTPRSGSNGYVMINSTPEKWRRLLRRAISSTQGIPEDKRFIFIKSWNEWAEGNHLEPDRKYGLAYLEAIRDELK
jgi:lipopolysaccharide biosynthesis protein